MGSFYVNVTVKGPTQDVVTSYIKDKNYAAYISPTSNDLTIIYEALCDTQEFRLISDFLKDISLKLGCVAIGVVNHDDDLLAYEIYENGIMHHEYDSTPGYFSESAQAGPEGGDAEYLCRVFDAVDNVQKVKSILRASRYDENGYSFQSDRHKDLCAALNLPLYAVGAGYNYISEGELPVGLKDGDLKAYKNGKRS